MEGWTGHALVIDLQLFAFLLVNNSLLWEPFLTSDRVLERHTLSAVVDLKYFVLKLALCYALKAMIHFQSWSYECVISCYGIPQTVMSLLCNGSCNTGLKLALC